MITARTSTSTAVLKFWNFPAGERGVKVEGWETLHWPTAHFPFDCRIKVDWKGNDDLIDLLLVTDAMREIFGKDAKICCDLPYFPYARQDRVMQYGESHSLRVVANLIRSCNFSKVTTIDAHSDVLAGLFGPGELSVMPQEEAFSSSWIANMLEEPGENVNTCLVAPDAGALKKVYKIAQKTGLPVITANKVRNVSDGQISHTSVEYNGSRQPMKFIVVDDIVDGGRTFIELAHALRMEYNIEFLVLWSSHGIYSKGLDVLTDDYSYIATKNNMSGLELPSPPTYNIFKDN